MHRREYVTGTSSLSRSYLFESFTFKENDKNYPVAGFAYDQRGNRGKLSNLVRVRMPSLVGQGTSPHQLIQQQVLTVQLLESLSPHQLLTGQLFESFLLLSLVCFSYCLLHYIFTPFVYDKNRPNKTKII